MENTKIKRTDLPSVKRMLITKQSGVCPICKKDITRSASSNIVIDHDHKTGIIRAALHRGCNRVEGSVLNTVTRWGKAKNIKQAIDTLRRLANFWELHSTNQTGLIYYTHKTATEKRLTLNKKRRNTAKRKRDEIKKLGSQKSL